MENKVAIFIPTLNRPQNLKPLVENIKEATPEPHEIYFMTSNEKSLKILKDLDVVVFKDEEGKGTNYVTRMNELYNKTTEPYIFTGSDDSYFHKGWLSSALNCMDDVISFVVPNDLLNPAGTQALIKRSYQCCIDTPDVLFYPEYVHDFSETEQFETAKKRGVFKQCKESIVEHMHWANGKSKRDDDYAVKEPFSEQDRQLFESRRHLWQ